MALGSLSIQKRANPGDCKLVTEIVRGKVKDPVEFGAKYDVSVALSVLVADLFGVRLPRLFLFYFMDAPDGVSSCHLQEIEDEAA